MTEERCKVVDSTYDYVVPTCSGARPVLLIPLCVLVLVQYAYVTMFTFDLCRSSTIVHPSQGLTHTCFSRVRTSVDWTPNPLPILEGRPLPRG